MVGLGLVAMIFSVAGGAVDKFRLRADVGWRETRMAANRVKRFKAVLEPLADGLGWTIARVPFVPGETWPEMVRLRVRGEVRSAEGTAFGFRTSLFPFAGGGGGYYLLVNNAAQRGAGVSRGEMAEFCLEPDLQPRPAELPEELAALLEEEPWLREWYDELSESMRREIGKWIALAKSDAARRNKCEQMAERLLAAMEGEKELPPVIAAAFRRRPKAKAGWEKMTEVQRRQHLLGVFYYQSVEAREKRVEKLCDEAEQRA